MKRIDFDEIIERRGTHTVKYDLRRLIFGREEVIPLWVADMDFRTPEFIVEAVQQRAAHEIYGYTIRPEAFYQSIQGWLLRRHNWKIKKNWIAFSPGVVPALALCVQAFTQPGDKILVQPPVYFPFFSTIKDNGRQLINNPLKLVNGRYQMDLADLEEKIDARTRMIFISNPHNPGGSVWTPNELKALGELCIKHHIIMVSDEIHSDLVFPNHKHTPLASLSEAIANQTITTMAPSKTFNMAGLATAFAVISNPQLYQQYQQKLDDFHLGNGNLFGVAALTAAYQQGDVWLDSLMEYLTGNVDFVIDFLARELPAIVPIRPEATYLLWLDFSALGYSQQELQQRLIGEAGLGLNDGVMFGFGGTGYQRLNVACPRQVLAQAMEQLKAAFQQS